MPPSNHAVKFYYPETVTLSVFDAAPLSNVNDENEGIFLVPGQTTTLTSTISNTGNVDLDQQIPIAATVTSFETGSTVYDDIQAINSLAIGETQSHLFF